MRIYTFHKPIGTQIAPEREDGFDAVEVLPDSLSFWAIVFPLPWLVWHKLWLELGFYLFAMMLIGGLLATPYAAAGLALSGLPGLYLWLEGHDLRRAKLRRKGYELVDVVEAKDKQTAFARFVAKQMQARRDAVARLPQIGMPAADPTP
ncbi:DUF2628 domain-containing protein [Pseudahrensia aquimaris]|uniref:DUF2628 domain-containing protein n=1 Tax=Pseudahrensia aquimaris TaxID=744461 RepID=A0ABW3FEN0_9HYPH